MNVATLSIKRPILITSIVLIILILGGISYFNIGMELIPDMSLPTMGVTTVYPGASPDEIDQLITKPLEDELGTISGLKHISSKNSEGLSVITLEFNMDVDVDRISQDVRDKINVARNNLPRDLEEDPVVSKFDPDSGSIIRLALISDLSPGEIYDLAKETIKPALERIQDVGKVNITGGSRREIQVEIDRGKMNEYVIPMTRIVSQMKNSGANVPVGKKEHGTNQTVFRAMGAFTNLDQIRNTLISFSGDMGGAVSVKTLGTVKDSIEDVTSAGFIYQPDRKNNTWKARSCVFLDVTRQSGKNTVRVVDRVRERLPVINESLRQAGGNSQVIVTSDQSRWIRTNVHETMSSIIIGIILAVVVVYLFLGNARSTFIAAFAIPNSLLGAVILMNVMGYTFNLMTLMALSLVVGLLVDDAIVVNENIFRKLEEGENRFSAAKHGTTEVMLAVIATTLAILSVFFPIGMLSGVIGKLFKQFGFTVVFAMVVSLFDALTVAPFLSAYFAGDGKKADNAAVRVVEKFQAWLDRVYVKIMGFCLRRPLVVIVTTLVIFILSIGLLPFVKKTFIPPGDQGEFSINIEMPAGTSLAGTQETLQRIGERIKKLGDLSYYSVSAGNANGEVTEGEINCFLRADRKNTTDQVKERVRSMMSEFAYANPRVNMLGRGSSAPFSMIVSGHDLSSVNKWSSVVVEKVKAIPDLADVNTTLKKGGPELRVNFDHARMQALGVSNSAAGTDLRYQIQGAVVGKLREKGLEYDIRARLKPEQRDLRVSFDTIMVPNSTGRIVPLNSVAARELASGYAQINRRDKAYIVEIKANLKPGGAVGSAMDRVKRMFNADVRLPGDMSYGFSGEAEIFSETSSSVAFAIIMAIIFIYLVLASLYESFVTPFAILLAVPPALTGAFLSLFLTGFMLDMFSMIGMIMLMGLVAKNSILLVDNAVHGVNAGLDRKEAILQAGKRRLRPILMTTFAMLAGMLPLALGIGEAAQMRQSMGISIMGGVIVSTLITLIVVPAVFEYIDRFREATESRVLVREEEAVEG